jgi:hypothetical protein
MQGKFMYLVYNHNCWGCTTKQKIEFVTKLILLSGDFKSLRRLSCKPGRSSSLTATALCIVHDSCAHSSASQFPHLLQTLPETCNRRASKLSLRCQCEEKKKRILWREKKMIYLADATSPIHFCWKMVGVEWRVFDHPKASDDLILAQPCTRISHSILKIEQFLSNENVSNGDSPRQTALHDWYMQKEGTS